MYEYVEPKEYGPVRQKIENLLKKANKELKEYDLDFEYCLIGSGRRGLITRIKGGNKGFDLDYNLIIDNPGNKKHIGRTINDHFMNAFRNAVKGTAYSDPEDSTSVLTIKMKDEKNSKIVHSCDLAIVYYDDEGFIRYLRHHKDTDGYGFQKRDYSDNLEDKEDAIYDYFENPLEEIKTEYLNLKNKNKSKEKRSFALFCETINNLYNEIPDEEEEEDDYYGD